MKGFFLIVFYLGFTLSSKLLSSATSMPNTESKFQVLDQVKDFTGCEQKKQDLIKEPCSTIGEKGNSICNSYKQNLQAKLDCSKQSCQEFYTTYNKEFIEKAKSQARYYRKNASKATWAKAVGESQTAERNQDAMIQEKCSGI